MVQHQLEGWPSGAEAQQVSRAHLHGHILDLAVVHKGATAGVEVPQNKAVLGVAELEGSVVVFQPCRLKGSLLI